MFLSVKKCCADKALRADAVVICHPVMGPLSFEMFSADFFHEALKNRPVVILAVVRSKARNV